MNEDPYFGSQRAVVKQSLPGALSEAPVRLQKLDWLAAADTKGCRKRHSTGLPPWLPRRKLSVFDTLRGEPEQSSGSELLSRAALAREKCGGLESHALTSAGLSWGTLTP